MNKIISIILFGLIFSQGNFAQPKLFGYKFSGNGDIISDQFLVQEGFVLDSAKVFKTYRFEYNEEGKLVRDINFISYPGWDSTGPLPRTIVVPGYRHYCLAVYSGKNSS